MNIAEFCFKKSTVTYGLTLAVCLAGIFSYFNLGRLEDPEYTIRQAQIVTVWPGASTREVAECVTDPLETAVQRLGKVKHVTSTSSPGSSVITVEVQDHYGKHDLPQIWDELRRKIADASPYLPEGCETPLVVDDYGDVYGVYFAISGKGYTMAELKEQAKLLRRELLLCKDVAKIDILGDFQEAVFFEISTAKLASLNIHMDDIRSSIASHTVPAEAGRVLVDDKFIVIQPSSRILSIKDFEDIVIGPDIYLRDVVTIHRDYADPPACIVKRNGEPCVTIGISTATGGNVITMCKDVQRRMQELKAEIPLGINVDVISHQASTVEKAINGFVINLLESVALVIAVLLLTMGLRSGMIIGGVLIAVVLAAIMVMDMMGIMFERISLGAFIIALGMLVDNAIVITEAVLVAAQKGLSKKQAAIDVVKQTQWALLGGTSIAILSFAPIGASRNSTGEYCRSLFLVIMISLIISWIMAITVTPLLAEKFLKADSGKEDKDPYASRFFRIYKAFLTWCVDNKFTSLFALACLLVMSIFGFRHIDQNFFPDSTRAQFMVHVRMTEGTAIRATDESLQALADHIRTLEGVTGITTFAGQGSLRFLLTYTPEDPDSAYGLMLVDVKSESLINGLIDAIEKNSPKVLPNAMIGCQRFVLGPGDPHRIQIRIIGQDMTVLRSLGEKALRILQDDGNLKEIQSDWRERGVRITPIISSRRSKKLGISRTSICDALRAQTIGLPVGRYLEKDEFIPILLRTSKADRSRPSMLYSCWAWNGQGLKVPLAQLIDGMEDTTQEMSLKRRDRSYCLTVKCNPSHYETADTAFQRVKPRFEEFAKHLPKGCSMQFGGEYEDSNEANKELYPTFGPILAIMVLVVLCLFNSVKKTLVIYMTLPLIMIGVVAGLFFFHKPFGFMALLGFLSLVGMQVKNAIVLMDEISARLEAGDSPYDAIISAGVSRVRPVSNASLTTILGMLPLATDPFYSAMAVTIMCGLAFSTVLTLVVIPVNYALIYRVSKNPA